MNLTPKTGELVNKNVNPRLLLGASHFLRRERTEDVAPTGLGILMDF